MATSNHLDLEVLHDAEASRYVLARDGSELGFAAYRRDGDVFDIFTTQIDPRRRGEGLGAVLVRDALDDIAARGGSVIASCWYVDEFLRSSPEHAGLRHDGGARHVDPTPPTDPGPVRGVESQGPAARAANPSPASWTDPATSRGAAQAAHEHGLSEVDPRNPRRR